MYICNHSNTMYHFFNICSRNFPNYGWLNIYLFTILYILRECSYSTGQHHCLLPYIIQARLNHVCNYFTFQEVNLQSVKMKIFVGVLINVT